jgi:two-component system, cell cycle sensor histidine kinase and response regulator CckA
MPEICSHMNNDQISTPPSSAFALGSQWLKHQLIEPLATIDDLAFRRAAQLLAIFLLVLLALFALVDTTRIMTTPGYRAPWYGYVLFGSAYALSRTRYYRLAACMAIGAFPLIILTRIVDNPAGGLQTTIHYLVLSIFLSSIFLSWRALAMLAGINIIGLLLLPIALPLAVPSHTLLVTPIAVNLIGTALALIYMRHRDQIERDRRAEQQNSERRFRVLLDHCADAVALLDRRGGIQYISPAATRILGYDLGALIGEHVIENIHPADRQRIAAQLDQLMLQPGSQLTAELRIGHANGSWRWFEATAVNSLAEPAIAGLVVNFHDVTERKQAEAALRDSEERYRMISELVSDYAYAYHITPGGSAVLEWVTDAFTRITAYTQPEMAAFDDWAAIVHPADRAIAERHTQQLLAGQADVCEHRIRAKDGRILWMRLYGRPLWDSAEARVTRIYGAVQDITQIKQLEQQLNQAHKMEAIGQLAGGIAHDFNNLLTVILGNTELLLDPATPIEVQRENAEQIHDTTKRAAALTRQLLAFSRQQVLEPRRLNINAVVTEMRQLLQRLTGEGIELVTQLASDLGHVHADPCQLEQVIMNLVVNARDAMPNGGTLSIQTANVVFGDGDMHKQRGVGRGRYSMLTISDTGMGMDAHTRARIFEPFFTTKTPGKGTGLGLATVHGIVAQSGGSIVVESAPNQGSTFTIYLPQADQASALAAAPGRSDKLLLPRKKSSCT